MPVLETFFLDASAIVRLFTNEPGAQEARAIFDSQARAFTSWVCLAEAMGVLKMKWLRRRKERPEDVDEADRWYGRAIHTLFHHIDRRHLDPLDIGPNPGFNNNIGLRTHRFEIIEIRRRFPELDAADALQLAAIQGSWVMHLAGESAIQLVTADADLAAAAKECGLRVRHICRGH